MQTHTSELPLFQEDPDMPSLVQMMRLISKDAVAQAKFFDLMINAMFTELLGTNPPLAKEYIPSYATASYEDEWASSCLGGVFGDIAAASGPVETQARGSLHPHILLWLPQFDMFDAFADMLKKATAQQLHAELLQWSRAVLHAASHMQYSCQELFAEQMQVPPVPLPFLHSHQKQSGPGYAHLLITPEEKDGHVRRAAQLGLQTTGEISLKGAFAATSPMYLRRESAASAAEYSQAIANDYRHGIIQNHFHKCTKSCHKKASKETALTICRFGCQHAQMVQVQADGQSTQKKCLYRGWAPVQEVRFQHVPEGANAAEALFPLFENGKCQTVRRHPFEGTSYPILQVCMRCNVDVKAMARGLSVEILDALLLLAKDDAISHAAKKRRIEKKTNCAAEALLKYSGSKCKVEHSRMKNMVIQVILETIRDQMDTQHYVGEYATKKFEVARDLLPELYKGLKRLERDIAAQEALQVKVTELANANATPSEQSDAASPQMHDAVAEVPVVSDVSRGMCQNGAKASAEIPAQPVKTTAQIRQARARQTLMRLATSMQRCLSKSKGEMTFQILFESEAFITFPTYKMFAKFPVWAVLECQQDAANELLKAHPGAVLQSVHAETQQQPDAETVCLHDAIMDADALELGDQEGAAAAGSGAKRHGSISLSKPPNQKDDFTHRSNHPLLAAMSVFMYSRCVRRVLKGPTTLPDNHRYFEFSSHYSLRKQRVQELRNKDIVAEISGLTMPTQAAQVQKNNAVKLALFAPHKPCAQASYVTK
jgi:hypothetical protein